MPVLIAVVLAAVVSALVFGVAASRSRPGDVADVRADPTGVGVAGAVAAQRHPALKRFLLARRDPSTETGLLLTLAVGFVAVAIFIVGSVLEMVNTNSGFARWDDAAARFGAKHATKDITATLRAISHLGTSAVALTLVIAVGLYYAVLKHNKAPLLFMLTTLLSTFAVYNVTKFIVNRERPDISRLVGAAGSSFPSGHTATAAATYAALALVLGRGRGRLGRGLLAGAAMAITFTVAATRVLLGVHWLTDVIAGMFVGWGCFALSSIAFGGRVLDFGRPVKIAEQTAAGVLSPDMQTEHFETTSSRSHR